MPDSVDPALLELRGVAKSYGSVQALRGADLRVGHNEVVALVGDNGAGKSTLVKVLSGVVQPDTGEILIDGQPAHFGGPADAHRAGIDTVFQDLALAEDLDAAANLFLGRELRRGGPLGRLGFLDKKEMLRQTKESFSSFGTGIQDFSVSIGAFSGGQRQAIAVGRATKWADKLVLMDEPTAALGVVQQQRVAEIIGNVRSLGRSVLIISHSMPFVFDVADRVEVLRLGQRVASWNIKDTTMEKVVGAMTGAYIPSGETS